MFFESLFENRRLFFRQPELLPDGVPGASGVFLRTLNLILVLILFFVGFPVIPLPAYARYRAVWRRHPNILAIRHRRCPIHIDASQVRSRLCKANIQISTPKHQKTSFPEEKNTQTRREKERAKSYQMHETRRCRGPSFARRD